MQDVLKNQTDIGAATKSRLASEPTLAAEKTARCLLELSKRPASPNTVATVSSEELSEEARALHIIQDTIANAPQKSPSEKTSKTIRDVIAAVKENISHIFDISALKSISFSDLKPRMGEIRDLNALKTLISDRIKECEKNELEAQEAKQLEVNTAKAEQLLIKKRNRVSAHIKIGRAHV